MSDMLSRKDNKPMTFENLFASLSGIRKEKQREGPEKFAKFMDQPVTLSSDEEGNNFNKLCGIELTKQGITLWPF